MVEGFTVFGFRALELRISGFCVQGLGFRALVFRGFASRQVVLRPFFASHWLNLYTVQPMGGKGPLPMIEH